jgi:hypothetical protein
MRTVRNWDISGISGPRAGYHAVTPRIVVSDVPGQVHFLQAVFGAKDEFPPDQPAEVRIGDSLIMITPAHRYAPGTRSEVVGRSPVHENGEHQREENAHREK